MHSAATPIGAWHSSASATGIGIGIAKTEVKARRQAVAARLLVEERRWRWRWRRRTRVRCIGGRYVRWNGVERGGTRSPCAPCVVRTLTHNTNVHILTREMSHTSHINQVLPHMAHWAFLTMTVVFVAHVQIGTRLLCAGEGPALVWVCQHSPCPDLHPCLHPCPTPLSRPLALCRYQIVEEKKKRAKEKAAVEEAVRLMHDHFHKSSCMHHLLGRAITFDCFDLRI